MTHQLARKKRVLVVIQIVVMMLQIMEDSRTQNGNGLSHYEAFKCSQCHRKTFLVTKKRLIVLRSPLFYDIQTRHIIFVCCMLYNLIRRKMTYNDMQIDFDDEQLDESKYIDNVEPTNDGFGWDSEVIKLIYHKFVFEDYVKILVFVLFKIILELLSIFEFLNYRPTASGLFNKSFPHYYTLGEIYGRDRATGANAGNADDDEEEVR
ncbi:hypothetical protein CUMW_121450 [Citrus unshiu]|nr:hypothetical protein CUMW_121450 [Citrus unshiu]